LGIRITGGYTLVTYNPFSSMYLLATSQVSISEQSEAFFSTGRGMWWDLAIPNDFSIDPMSLENEVLGWR
jgi:hypothetical protein